MKEIQIASVGKPLYELNTGVIPAPNLTAAQQAPVTDNETIHINHAPTLSYGAAMEKIGRLEKTVDAAYYERNVLVSVLSKLYVSYQHPTEIDGWEKEWHNCVYIELPTGQVSYHYHDRDAELFAHVERHPVLWDQHTKDDVHARWLALNPAGDFMSRKEIQRWTDKVQSDVMGCIDLRAHEEQVSIMWLNNIRDAFVKPFKDLMSKFVPTKVNADAGYTHAPSYRPDY